MNVPTFNKILADLDKKNATLAVVLQRLVVRANNIDPALPQSDEMIFSVEELEVLELYRDRAETLNDFQAFMSLIDMVIQDNRLSPAQDRDRVAKLLNKYRVEKNLQPL